MASAEADRFDPVVIDKAGDAWFASDLHLDDDLPELTARFLGALRALAGTCPGITGPVADEARPALFLIGDLFEYWIGDDHPSRVAAVLASGSMGPGRLTEVGPSAPAFMLALGLEVLVGAAILLLSPVVTLIAKDYLRQRKLGVPPVFDASRYPEIKSQIAPGTWDDLPRQ